MDIGSLTVNDFLAHLGSSDPTPGGGALAALSGAMAAAMLAMVCNLTLGSPRYADVEPEVQRILNQTVTAQSQLLDLANRDAAAYEAVRDAYRMPRSNDAERVERSAAIEQSMHGASIVPVEAAEVARSVVDLAIESAEIMNVTVLGDVAVAARIAVAAAQGAADQAGLNLDTMKDVDFVSDMRGRLERALHGVDILVTETVTTIHTRTAE
jgi:methenyltetrahydrofolate cyclohydrolase